MLRKDMSLLDLELLELQLKLKMGDSYSGSPVQVCGDPSFLGWHFAAIAAAFVFE
jgi:hypothetical protein